MMITLAVILPTTSMIPDIISQMASLIHWYDFFPSPSERTNVYPVDPFQPPYEASWPVNEQG